MELLIQGSQGDEVLALQEILKEIGYNIEPSGCYCARTTEAVLDFQRVTSIPVDGAVGDITWAFLLNVQALKARGGTP
ncbi:MAG: peptidoglycan-binding protein [Cryomorphaceae bacterium]|nr:MAG: peptidoglycan-binding protein [Cryomorphaceae bacterium]